MIDMRKAIMALMLAALLPAQASAKDKAKAPEKEQAPDEDAVIAAWTACLTGQADRLAAASREPAATIADGALGLCSERQNAVQQLYVRASGVGGTQGSATWIRGHVEEWRRKLIGRVLDRRAQPQPVRKKR